MTVPTKTILEVPHTGLGEALGLGLARGGELGLQSLLKKFTAVQEARKKALEPFTASEMNKELKAGYGYDIEHFTPEDTEKLLNKANQLIKKHGRKKTLAMIGPNIDKYLTNEIDTLGEKEIEEDKKKRIVGKVSERPTSQLWQDLFEGGAKGRRGFDERLAGAEGRRTLAKDLGPSGPFAKGIKSSSSGKLTALLRGETLKEYQKGSVLGPKANLWDKILYTIGNFSGETPAFIGGGAVGMAGGGPIGTGVGAFAMPAFLNQSLTEFMRFKERGGKGSFEDYINAGGRIASESTQAGALGAIFGILGKAIPVMKAANPAMKKFFETTKAPKLKEFLGTSTLQSLGLVGAEAAAKRKLPTKGEVASTFAQVFGLNLLGLGTNRAKGIVERIRRTKEPAKTVEKISKAADKAGIDREKLRAGEPEEIKKMARVVEDITKTEEGRIREGKIRAKEKISKELAPEKLEEKAKEISREAKRLSKAPLEEYLKERVYKETPSQKTLKEEASKKLERVDQDISDTKKTLKDLSDVLEAGIKNKNQKKTVEVSKKNLEKRLTDLEEIRKDLEYQKRKGRKPFSKAEEQAKAKKHVQELEQAARNPESKTAQEWERRFDRDQKYIDQQVEILKRGKEPIAPYKDTFLKVHEAYNEIYRKALEDVTRSLEGAKGKEKSTLQKIHDKLKRNLAINEGKLAKHKDKLASKQAIKQGSPILRHLLRQFKKDLPGMQKPIIEYKKAMEGREAKISKVFEKNVNKIIKQVVEDPSATKIENIIKENIPTEPEKVEARKEAKKVQEQSKKVYKNAKEVIAEGLKEGKTSTQIAKDLIRTLSGLSLKDYRNKVMRSIAGAILFGGIRKAIEAQFGIKVPFSTLAFLLPIFKGMRFGAAAIGYFGSKILDGIMLDYHRKKYKELKLPGDRRRYIQKLKDKGWKGNKIKEVMAKS